MPTQNPVELTRVPFFDFPRRWRAHRDGVHAAMDRVGERGQFILGPEVAAFEQTLARLFHVPFAVGCGNGMDALEIALRCAGVGAGDRVLTTPLSAFASSLAILRIGAVPVFIDVDDSGLIDLSIAEEVLAGERIPYVLPVHLYGHAADLRRLRRLTERYGVTVIEDCAQAVLATSDGLPVGSAGPCAATSFYPTKNLGCLGDGGAVLLESAGSAERARAWRDYGQSGKYRHAVIGLNSRLDEVQAAILVSVLVPALEAETARRRSLAARYRAELRNSHLCVPPVPPGSDSVWHLFPVLVEGRRDAFCGHLDRRGIASAIHYPRLIPDQDAILQLGKPVCLSALGNAERFARAEVSLPLHPYLTDDEAGRVVAACNDWDGA